MEWIGKPIATWTEPCYRQFYVAYRMLHSRPVCETNGIVLAIGWPGIRINV